MKNLLPFALLTALSVLLPTATAYAQINPYAPPGPGWVVVQVCGQEAQWAPPNHPLALVGICAAPENQPPTPGTEPPDVFQAGHVYRSRTYHMVIIVTRVTLTEQFNFTTLEIERTAMADTITYQSEEAYRARRNGIVTQHNPTDTWEWFEIAR